MNCPFKGHWHAQLFINDVFAVRTLSSRVSPHVLNKWKYWFIIVHVLWSRFMKMLLQSASWCSERQRRVYSSSKQIICGTIRLITFTFMHLADAFIQRDLQCIQVIHFFVSICVPWESNPQPLPLSHRNTSAQPILRCLQHVFVFL